jgi:hypothetical protein
MSYIYLSRQDLHSARTPLTHAAQRQTSHKEIFYTLGNIIIIIIIIIVILSPCLNHIPQLRQATADPGMCIPIHVFHTFQDMRVCEKLGSTVT